MLIEHDGKTIDTEREIQKADTKLPARFVGQAVHTSKETCVWVEYVLEPLHSYWADWFGSPQYFVREFENVQQTHVRWLNVYDDDPLYETKEEAMANGDASRIACVRIEWQS